MGDIANMTSVHGEVDGHRLLRWLRSREKLADQRALGMLQKSRWEAEAYQLGVRDVLREMAEDLERELTPPDYTEDDDEFTLLGLMTTGPCDGCGRVTDRVSVQDNGRAWFACQDCADRLGADAVDMDDMAEMKTCPDCGREHRGKVIGGDRCLACSFERGQVDPTF